MRLLLLLLATAIAALALGLSSAWYMVVEPRTGTQTIGAWTALPAIDAESADPYVRARIARTGEISMGMGQGLEFVAETDDSGRRLDGRCDYLLSGQTPPARLWTLVALDQNGAVTESPTGRSHLQSREILRGDGGRFEVAVSATARAGNWLPAPSQGAIRLVLRLYDAPTGYAMAGGAAAGGLPHVERGSCR